jgi:hypothetical protein
VELDPVEHQLNVKHSFSAHSAWSSCCSTTLIARTQCSAAAAPDQQQRRDAPILKQLAVGLAAAALLHSAPADAGVILQKSSLKKASFLANARCLIRCLLKPTYRSNANMIGCRADPAMLASCSVTCSALTCHSVMRAGLPV